MTEKEKEISWRAAEFEYVKKDVGWYVLVGVAALVLGVIALWQRNFFFFIFVILALVVVFSFSGRRPRVLEFKIGEKGVWAGKEDFYEYDKLEAYVVRKREGRLDELVLRKKTKVNPYIKIPVDEKTGEGAVRVLGNRLPKFEYHESLVDLFGEWMGF